VGLEKLLILAHSPAVIVTLNICNVVKSLEDSVNNLSYTNNIFRDEKHSLQGTLKINVLTIWPCLCHIPKCQLEKSKCLGPRATFHPVITKWHSRVFCFVFLDSSSFPYFPSALCTNLYALETLFSINICPPAKHFPIK